jgi:hypothetical protein
MKEIRHFHLEKQIKNFVFPLRKGKRNERKENKFSVFSNFQEVCSMVTAPEVFGAGAAAVGQNRDPCPRYRKYVEVAYKCKPTQVNISFRASH